MKKRKILGACLGTCVHVAGIMNFLNLAEDEGYETHFLGTAIPVDKLVEHIRKKNPEIVALSYRLTPRVAKKLITSLEESIGKENLGKEISFVFGGTEPVVKIAKESGFFDALFSPGSPTSEVIAYLRGQRPSSTKERLPQDIISRIKYRQPYPLLRHHYGRPSLEETVQGIRDIAEAEVLDVVSLGPDQNAQQFFFHPKEMDPAQSGAGGVTIRTASDLEKLYQSTRCGNYPLMRCYSGTNDLLQMAGLLQKTIHNAWAAIPLCWYNVLDGRSERGLEESITENLDAVTWHAEREIPVEMNESHHWGLREAHDAVSIAAAYLAAYNAKKRGVKNYFSQYMLNTPPRTSHLMDLAKMLAQIDLIESLHDDQFRSYRQFRAGLFSFPHNPEEAKGQLSASTYLAMTLEPDIYHVVGYSEGHHAAMAPEVIESCAIARQVIEVCLQGIPDPTLDPRVQERREELVAEARVILEAFPQISSSQVDDPLADITTLVKGIKMGILDAPHLAGNPHARGALVTKEIEGAYYAYDPLSDRVIPEEERIGAILSGMKEKAINDSN